jgi:hypothetical protein
VIHVVVCLYVGMSVGIRAIGIFGAIKLCEMYAKVRRNVEEIVLVRKEAKQYLEYMKKKRDEVLERLDQVEASMLAIDPSMADSYPLAFSGDLKVYALDKRDAARNKLYLRGVRAVLKRSVDYYTCLIAKGQKFFRPIVSPGSVVDIREVDEVPDLNAYLEEGGDINANVLFSSFE